MAKKVITHCRTEMTCRCFSILDLQGHNATGKSCRAERMLEPVPGYHEKTHSAFPFKQKSSPYPCSSRKQPSKWDVAVNTKMQMSWNAAVGLLQGFQQRAHSPARSSHMPVKVGPRSDKRQWERARRRIMKITRRSQGYTRQPRGGRSNQRNAVH